MMDSVWVLTIPLHIYMALEGSEFGEKLGSTTMTYNLVVYLTSRMHLPLAEALCVSTAAFSASSLAPLFGEFLADAYLGRFTAVAAGSVFYLGGLVLFNILAMASKLQPGTCHGESNWDGQCHQATWLQMGVLFLSLTLQTMGSGGLRPCAALCGADQCHDSSNSVHQSQIQNFFNCNSQTQAEIARQSRSIVSSELSRNQHRSPSPYQKHEGAR